MNDAWTNERASTGSSSADAPRQASATQDHDADRPTNFWDWIRSTGIRRSDSRWLAGVCGGIAERTGLDPMIIRGIVLVVAILGGPAFLFYAAAWALMPDSSGRIHVERLFRGVFDPAIIAIGVLATLTVLPFARGIWWQGAPAWWNMPGWLEATLGTAWVILLVAGIVWLIVLIARSGIRQPAEEPKSHADFWTNPAQTPPPGVFTVSDDGVRRETFPAAGSTSGPQQASYVPPAQGPSTAGWQQRQAEDAERRRAAHEARMRAQQERARAQQERMRAQQERMHAQLEHMRASRLGAAFVAISLGLAVVAAALGANLASRTDGLTDHVLVVALASGLGVLAVAIVIAGIRGRESGWLGFFSFAAVIALLVAGVFPRGAQFSPFGNPDWEAGRGGDQSYAIIAGGPELDLRSLDDATEYESSTIDVWVGAGELTLLLPEKRGVDVQLNAFVGGIGYRGDSDAREFDRGGLFFGDDAQFGRASASDLTTVRVWLFAGHVEVEQ